MTHGHTILGKAAYIARKGPYGSCYICQNLDLEIGVTGKPTFVCIYGSMASPFHRGLYNSNALTPRCSLGTFQGSCAHTAIPPCTAHRILVPQSRCLSKIGCTDGRILVGCYD